MPGMANSTASMDQRSNIKELDRQGIKQLVLEGLEKTYPPKEIQIQLRVITIKQGQCYDMEAISSNRNRDLGDLLSLGIRKID